MVGLAGVRERAVSGRTVWPTAFRLLREAEVSAAWIGLIPSATGLRLFVRDPRY